MLEPGGEWTTSYSKAHPHYMAGPNKNGQRHDWVGRVNMSNAQAFLGSAQKDLETEFQYRPVEKGALPEFGMPTVPPFLRPLHLHCWLLPISIRCVLGMREVVAIEETCRLRAKWNLITFYTFAYYNGRDCLNLACKKLTKDCWYYNSHNYMRIMCIILLNKSLDIDTKHSVRSGYIIHSVSSQAFSWVTINHIAFKNQ